LATFHYQDVTGDHVGRVGGQENGCSLQIVVVAEAVCGILLSDASLFLKAFWFKACRGKTPATVR
jgi:hypothetical protein